MSSADAMNLLNDADLEKSLGPAVGVADNFQALLESIVAKRTASTDIKIASIKDMTTAKDSLNSEAPYDNLTTLFDNYSTIVKRDYTRLVADMMKVSNSLKALVNAAPNGWIIDPATLNDKIVWNNTLLPVRKQFAFSAYENKVQQSAWLVNATLNSFNDVELNRSSRKAALGANIFRIEGGAGYDSIRGDPIITLREALQDKEDNYIEQVLTAGITGLTDAKALLDAAVGEMSAPANPPIHHHFNLHISLAMSKYLGPLMLKLAVLEHDMLKGTGATGQGPLMSETIRIFNALKGFESKVFGTNHTQASLDIRRLDKIFEAYAVRIAAVVATAPNLVADTAAKNAFKLAVSSSGKSATTVESELTAGII